MFKSKILIWSSIAFLLSNCGNIENKGSSVEVKKEYYNEGAIKIVKSLINDTILDGLYQEYYLNGNKKYEVIYENNIKNGKELYFFTSGKKKSQLNWKNGIKIGEGFNYFENGMIQSYLYYDLEGVLVYKRNYNQGGEWESDEGTAIIYSSIKEKSFKKGDGFKNVLTVANPPHSSSLFYVTDFDEQNNMTNPKQINIIGGEVVHSETLNKKGQVKFGYRLVIQDSILKSEKTFLYGVKIPVE